MEIKTKHPQTFFRLETELVKKLDRRITRAGYNSRSEFFTAVAYAALYGAKTANKAGSTAERPDITNIPETELDGVQKLPKPVVTWLEQTMPALTEEQIQHSLHQILADMLIPVLAMKGVDLAYQKTWKDVQTIFHDKTGIWTTESDIHNAYISFAALNRTMLEAYRRKQMQDTIDQ